MRKSFLKCIFCWYSQCQGLLRCDVHIKDKQPFVAAAGCIVSLPSGKQTDRKCLECAVTYQLNHEERVFQIPTSAGGQDYTQQPDT